MPGSQEKKGIRSSGQKSRLKNSRNWGVLVNRTHDCRVAGIAEWKLETGSGP